MLQASILSSMFIDASASAPQRLRLHRNSWFSPIDARSQRLFVAREALGKFLTQASVRRNLDRQALPIDGFAHIALLEKKRRQRVLTAGACRRQRDCSKAEWKPLLG